MFAAAIDRVPGLHTLSRERAGARPELVEGARVSTSNRAADCPDDCIRSRPIESSHDQSACEVYLTGQSGASRILGEQLNPRLEFVAGPIDVPCARTVR